MTVVYEQNTARVRAGTFEIASGQSLSDEIIVGGHGVVRLEIPTITTAALTFKVRNRPGGELRNLYDELGNEVEVPASTGDQVVQIGLLSGIFSVVVRSGTAASPVNQGATRTIGFSATGEAPNTTLPFTVAVSASVDTTGLATEAKQDDIITAIGAIPGGGGNQYDEDTAHQTGDSVTVAGVVRKDSAASLADTDGDYSALIVDANGRLHVIEPSAAGAAASLAVIDDWDESDRAKVNLIAGQAGITAGAGAVAANTPRMTLASDDPGVAAMEAVQAAVEGTLAVSAAALPLPSGAATETTLDAVKTATELIDDAVYADDADWADNTSKHVLTGGVRSDTPNAITDGDTGPLRVNSEGELMVQVEASALPSGAATEATLAAVDGHVDGIEALLGTIDTDTGNIATAASAIQTAVQIMDDWDESDRAKVNLIVGQAGVAAGAGAVGATVQRVTLASDDPAVASLALLDDAMFTDDAGFTPGSSKGIAIGVQADESSPDSVNEGDFGVLRMSLERFLAVTARPTATGEGLDVARNIDVDESEDDIKTSAGKLYGWFIYNLASSKRYVKFYNATAASTTVGTTTPFLTIPLDGGTGAVVEFTNGIPFSTALCIAATTGVADNDTGAPGANEIVANVFYK